MKSSAHWGTIDADNYTVRDSSTIPISGITLFGDRPVFEVMLVSEKPTDGPNSHTSQGNPSQIARSVVSRLHIRS